MKLRGNKMKCNKCDEEMKVDNTRMLATDPPQKSYYCPECDPHPHTHNSQPAIDNSDDRTMDALNPYQEINGAYGMPTGEYEYRPTIVYRNYYLTIDGITRILNPKEDVTPIELWKIIEWIDFFNINQHCDVELLYGMVLKNGISRHFDTK